MRNTAFLVLGVLLIVLQGETYLVFAPLAARGFRPSLLVPMLVYLGVAESNLALSAAIAFLLGYVLDVVSGSPVGLHAFSSVAVLVLARSAGVRIVTRASWWRPVLAGGFAGLASVMAIVLFAIFGKRPYVPRSLMTVMLPHAVATAVCSPLVFRICERLQTLATGWLEPSNRTGVTGIEASARRVLDLPSQGRRRP